MEEVVGEHFPSACAGTRELVRLAAQLDRATLDRPARLARPDANRAPLDAAPVVDDPATTLALARECAGALLERLLPAPELRSSLDRFARGWLGTPIGVLSAPAFLLPWYRYQAYGGSYPDGGSAAIVRALSAGLEAAGGSLELACAASRIVVARGRVRGVQLADGRTIQSPVVVSNGSPLHTFRDLVGQRALDRRYLARLERGAPTVSCVRLWLGLGPRPLASLPADYEVMLVPPGDPAADPLDPRAAPLAVARPAALDPSVARAGLEQLIVTMVVPAQAWHAARGARPDLGAAVADAILDRLERELVPGLRASIAVRSIATPDTFARRIGSPAGCIYGWQLAVGQTQGWRLPAQTPIDRLWLVGASCWPGPGVTSVLRSGRVVADAILRARGGRADGTPFGPGAAPPRTERDGGPP